MREVDLRGKLKGCTQDPSVKLSSVLVGLRSGEAVKLLLNEEDLPLRALQLLALRRGLELEVLSRSRKVTQVILRRQ